MKRSQEQGAQPLLQDWINEFKQQIALYENMEECDKFSDSAREQSGFVLRDHALENP